MLNCRWKAPHSMASGCSNPQCRMARSAAYRSHTQLFHQQKEKAAGSTLHTSPFLQHVMTAGRSKTDDMQCQAVPDRQDQAESGVDAEEEEFSIEEELRGRRRKKKGKVTVVAPQVQQAYGGEPKSVAGTLETYYVGVLGLAFVIILFEGLFVAVSGFLPESADQFAQDVVYPAFSPSVGVFLALSTLYGIWKSRQ